MASDITKMTRLVKIVSLLRQNVYPNHKTVQKALCALDIAGAYNVSQKTIQRDIQHLRDMYAAPIAFDNGKRGLLNFGHTFGHAIEKLSNFTVSHGAAVAKGMVIAAKFAPLCGLADVEKELTALLERYNFNLECPYTAEQLFDVILSDKKRRGGNLTLVLPRAIGDCDLVTMPVDEVLVKLKQIL